MSIEVANESGTAVDETALVGMARHVLDSMRVHPLAELSILLVDEAEMTRLHERWMGEPGPTDVLAFPMDELRPGGADDSARDGARDPRDTAREGSRGSRRDAGRSAEESGSVVPSLLGDIVLCPAVAAEQAKAAGHTLGDELDLLCTHGVLHLLGYDHAEPDQHREMFDLQARLLATWLEKRRIPR